MDAEKRKLIEENRRLRARLEELEGMVRALQEQVELLTAELEESQRAGKRQATGETKMEKNFLSKSLFIFTTVPS